MNDLKERVARVYYQPCRGEVVGRFQLAYVRGDHWVIEFGRKFYVASPCYEQAHGGRVPKALIESWACETLTDAIDRLDDMLESMRVHCEQFGNE